MYVKLFFVYGIPREKQLTPISIIPMKGHECLFSVLFLLFGIEFWIEMNSYFLLHTVLS